MTGAKIKSPQKRLLIQASISTYLKTGGEGVPTIKAPESPGTIKKSKEDTTTSIKAPKKMMTPPKNTQLHQEHHQEPLVPPPITVDGTERVPPVTEQEPRIKSTEDDVIHQDTPPNTEEIPQHHLPNQTLHIKSRNLSYPVEFTVTMNVGNVGQSSDW